jgi:thiol-disulfide isomerase/thioredoxin
MKKRFMLCLLLVISVFALTGCGKKEEEEKKEVNESAVAFKEAYESLNGKKDDSGASYRTVSISEDNPFIEVTASDILEKIENGETFYVYFGDELCPWCRSVIETAVSVAKKNNISKVYYVSIWDEDGNEILRDTYKLNKKNKAVVDKEGTEEYTKLLEAFDNVLSEYKLTTSKGKKVSTGEKRIYAPNFIYVENGKAVRLVEGISDLQNEEDDELTQEILADEEKIFTEFFK